jgi:N-acetylglucosaminyldiphosphoundecaprenol N-acetyl-beta-D-mannosaminyltransferase
LLGAGPGVAETAASKIEKEYPKIRVVGTQSPPIGFEKSPVSNDASAELVARAAPDILVLGLGAPKQELWAHRERHRLAAKVILCAGATIDFLAGARERAPVFFQRYGLEWAHRALGEPRRLFPRYARDAATLPFLLADELLKRHKRRY